MASYNGPVEIFINDESLGEGEATLTSRQPTGPRLGSWGGTLTADGGVLWRLLGENDAELLFPDGKRGRFVLASYSVSSRATDTASIQGNGPSPFG